MKRRQAIFALLVVLTIMSLAGNQILADVGTQILPGTTPMSEKEAIRKLEFVLDNEQAPVDWGQIHEAMDTLHRTKNPRCREIMARILDRKTPMVLAEGSPIPSILPPLEISQSLAVRILVKMKATDQIERIRAVSQRTTFWVLRQMCQQAIKDLGGTVVIDTGDK